jgi:hypothetical protein
MPVVDAGDKKECNRLENDNVVMDEEGLLRSGGRTSFIWASCVTTYNSTWFVVPNSWFHMQATVMSDSKKVIANFQLVYFQTR